MKKLISFLSKYDKKEVWFFSILFSAFILFFSFNLNLSSISEWKNYTDSRLESGLVFGKPKGIRSDEWMVQNPYFASQAFNNFNVENSSIGPGKSTLLAGVPVKSIYGYAQPRFWGFYLAGFDRGLSWIYAFRIFGLLFSAFLVFRMITKNDFWLSVTGSFWITFSSFTQWWFGTNLPDMMIGSFLSIFSIYSIFYFDNKYKEIAYGFLLFFSAFTFVTALYPPFQIPLGYLSLFILIGLLLRDKLANKINFSKIFSILVPSFLILIILYSWFIDASKIIQLVLESVYPGKRLVSGGGLNVYEFISGFLGPFLTQNQFPKILGNVCESANFYYVFLLLPLVVYWGNRKNIIKNPLNISLILYLILILIWLFIGYGETVANLTQMAMSPPHRSIIGIGLANIFLCISIFSSGTNVRKAKNKYLIQYTLIIITMSVFITYVLYKYFPDFMTISKAFVSLFLICIFSYSFLYVKKYLFILGIFLITLNGLFVNPIVQGASVIRDPALINLLNSKGERRWIVFSDLVRPQYLKAHGEKVLNGTKYISDLDDMEILDPQHKYKEIWYRYSHLLVFNDNKINEPEFKLSQSDVVELRLNICSKEIKLLKVTHAAFNSQQNITQVNCLKPLSNEPIDGMWLYSLK